MHSVKDLGFEVLNILGHTGGSSRMELFHAFDGKVDWHTIKTITSILLEDELIKIVQADRPFAVELVLTTAGKNLFAEINPEEQEPTAQEA